MNRLSEPLPVRFEARREEIIAAATALLNRNGVRSMTLADVAAARGMAPTGVAYYFRRKEELAAACFISGLDRLGSMVAVAAGASTARERVRRLWTVYFEHKAQVARGEALDIPIFSDVRTLSGPVHAEVAARYAAFVRGVRELLRADGLAWLRGVPAWARAHLIIEHLFWLNVWLPWFEPEDYPRLCARSLDILLDGIAADHRPDPPPLEIGHEVERSAAFLIAATRQVNIHGYRGASVERIAAALKRTKGAFYHHHNSKDEVLVAGFERTFRLLRDGQSAAIAVRGDALSQLQSAVATLLAFQLSADGPLMRTSALQSLPTAKRHAMIERANRVTARFAGMIADGVAEGVMRPVDPLIAAQMVTAAINAVADVWLGGPQNLANARIGHYSRPILYGLFAPNPGPAA